MPRHTFRFPDHIKKAIQKHVREACSEVSPSRFRQEPPRTAALASRIQGCPYDGPDGKVVFTATVVDDRGPGAAERWTGADLAITAEITDTDKSIEKAILIQAKASMPGAPSEIDRLVEQILKMKEFTRSPKILDLQPHTEGGIPAVLSGTTLAQGGKPLRIPLDKYFTWRVLTTLDGDTRPSFVDAVQTSDLNQLKVVASIEVTGDDRHVGEDIAQDYPPWTQIRS